MKLEMTVDTGWTSEKSADKTTLPLMDAIDCVTVLSQYVYM